MMQSIRTRLCNPLVPALLLCLNVQQLERGSLNSSFHLHVSARHEFQNSVHDIQCVIVLQQVRINLGNLLQAQAPQASWTTLQKLLQQLSCASRAKSRS